MMGIIQSLSHVEILTYTKKASLITSQGICATIIKKSTQHPMKKKEERITVINDINITLEFSPLNCATFAIKNYYLARISNPQATPFCLPHLKRWVSLKAQLEIPEAKRAQLQLLTASRRWDIFKRSLSISRLSCTFVRLSPSESSIFTSRVIRMGISSCW